MKKTLIALMALAGVAAADTITEDTTMAPADNYYAGAFDFSFALPEVLTDAPVYLLGYYANPAASGSYSGNVFTLKKNSDTGAITLSFDRVASLTVTDGNITGVGGIHNSSVFASGGAAYTLTAGTYTVEYLGGNNNAAAANLYLGESLVASFTGGAHNMNGGGEGGTNPLNVKVNESYVIPAVPEPTTATLSLLALAGLAARRRRK